MDGVGVSSGKCMSAVDCDIETAMDDALLSVRTSNSFNGSALGAAARIAAGDALYAEMIASRQQQLARPILVSLAGSQGSGKSTRVAAVRQRVEERGLRAAILGLDDFYLTATERQVLATDIHPLLATRGVPGTHNLDLLDAAIVALLDPAMAEHCIRTPAFDKLADDRLPLAGWHKQRGGCDVVLLEGWCVGARPQCGEALTGPINVLEAQDDPDGSWRRYINVQLGGSYAALFARFDLRLMLRAPDFACVYRWRAEQEATLAAQPGALRPPMDEAALQHFIAHYERITRWMLEDEPADLIACLDEDRAPVAWRFGPA